MDALIHAGEGDHAAIVDINGMTADRALTAVVIQIEDCEGVVLAKMWDGGSYAQHRLVDKP